MAQTISGTSPRRIEIMDYATELSKTYGSVIAQLAELFELPPVLVKGLTDVFATVCEVLRYVDNKIVSRGFRYSKDLLHACYKWEMETSDLFKTLLGTGTLMIAGWNTPSSIPEWKSTTGYDICRGWLSQEPWGGLKVKVQFLAQYLELMDPVMPRR